ncbi:MAG TPA: DMSO reductase [Gammaproteobacteria bacterium]|nr:DMSO reductase [Gammaproteobacteria bacterium]
MHPAFSVIFLTTLIGAGQGLFLALVTGQSYAAVGLVNVTNPNEFYTYGSIVAILFLIAGLGASFFHLGRPERAWRSAARWRTSWLSREVIVLPIFMSMVFAYGLLHYFNWDPNILGAEQPLQGQLSLFIGIIGAVVCFALFLSTGMIYACMKFLQEWYTPLTVINYTLLGSASGFMLATLHAAIYEPGLTSLYGVWATIITLVALLTRLASLYRNARIKYKSSMQSAIGVRHNNIDQKAMGMMGGSFNTREFFHGASPFWFRSIRWTFLIMTFPVPLAFLWAGLETGIQVFLLLAFISQYLGLIAERWFFFAQANHPQNIYYQAI